MNDNPAQNLANARLAFIALQGLSVFRPAPGRAVGGAETQMRRLAAALTGRFGCRACFICLGDQDQLEEYDGLEVAVIDRGHGQLAKVRRIKEALREYAPTFVLQRASGLDTFLAGRYARRCGARFVYMLAHDRDARKLPWREELHWRRMLYRRGLRSADRIVAQSEFQVNSLKCYWGLDAELIRSLQEPPGEPVGSLAAKKEGLLWVGRAVEVKQPELFLELAKRMPQIPCTMILNRTHREEYFAKLRTEAEGLSNVRFVESVAPDEIMSHFRAARLLVSTSRDEGFPNTHLDAFRAATPVMTLAADPDDLIAENELGFFAQGDFEALAREIEKRYSDAEWLAATGRRAADYLRDNHDPEKITSQWGALLGKLIK